jgi:hypothetical protein
MAQQRPATNNNVSARMMMMMTPTGQRNQANQVNRVAAGPVNSRAPWKKFNISTQVSPQSMIFILGKRKTGKTQLIRDFCYQIHMQKCQGVSIDTCIVFSPTEGVQQTFGAFVPEVFIYNTFREDVIMQLMAKQKEMLERAEQRTKNVMVIIDDCAFDKKVWKSPALREISMNGRHCKIMVIVTVQYCMDIPTDLRANIDLTIALKNNSRNDRKKYLEYYFGQFNSPKEFNQAFDLLTDDYGAIISISDNSSNNIQETIFWYKSDPKSVPERFRFGNPAFWALNDICTKRKYKGLPPTNPTPQLSSFSSNLGAKAHGRSNSNDLKDETFNNREQHKTYREAHHGTAARRNTRSLSRVCETSTAIGRRRPTVPARFVL